MANHRSRPNGQHENQPEDQVARQRENLSRLGEQITELAAHLDAGEYRFLVLVDAFDREGGWHGEGIDSCAHWLNWRCGLSLGVAREKLRVARALPMLPGISHAFSEGRVSYSKVRAMTRVATPSNERALLNVALHGTAQHVETQVRLYRQVKRCEALAQENLRYAQRELFWHVDDSGFWVFRGRLTPEQGAVIAKALEAAMEREFQEHRDAADAGHLLEPIAKRRADALERVAVGYLARPEGDSAGGDRYTVHIHTDVETLRTDGTGAEAEVEDAPGCGSHVPAETCRRLACDAAVVQWNENADGDPLSVGRRTRTIPPAIRRALKRRDGGCRFPGCSATRFVDAHHVHHWADGGETRMSNLVLLCRRHHRLLHEGGCGVEAQPCGAFRFTRPNGTLLPEAPDGRSCGNVEALRNANAENGLRITPRTSVPDWWGEEMDHQMAVQVLLQRD